MQSNKAERLVSKPGSDVTELSFAEISRAAAAPPQEPVGGGGSAKKVAKSISSFKILRPDEVWQPRVGARPGNKNALKHGRYTAERKAHRKQIAAIDAGVRELLRKARRVVFKAEEIARNRASSNPP